MSTTEDQVENTADAPELELPETLVDDAAAVTAAAAEENRWPGWPGYCVFRMVVPVLKVGSIIGRKGDLVKKLCEETRARVRVLDGPVGNPDRIVLITGKEEPESPLSPAMDAAIRVFKRVSGLSESESESDGAVAGAAFCSLRLLVAASQAMSLIGKQGSSIKSMQESTGATIRILNNDELPLYATKDERVAELQGEAAKVLKALEAVVGHLRKFLVDQTVLPLFEKQPNAPNMQEHQADPWAEKSLLHNTSRPRLAADYPPQGRPESMFLERETQLEHRLASSGGPLYAQDAGLSALRSSGLGRPGGPVVTQVAQTMQIPLSYAEDIIGIGGANIAYIRRASGAILTVQESRGLPDEITVEIKGTSLQVQTAQQLINDFVSSHKEPAGRNYSQVEDDLMRPSSYPQPGGSAYSASSLPHQQPYGGAGGAYGPSGGLGGGYGASYRY